MKRTSGKTLSTIAGIVIALGTGSITFGCGGPPKISECREIIAVEPHGATRIFIEYIDNSGDYSTLLPELSIGQFCQMCSIISRIVHKGWENWQYQYQS